jgi:hypothetical protein
MNILNIRSVSQLEKSIIFDRAAIRGAVLLLAMLLIFQSIKTLYVLILCNAYIWGDYFLNVLFLYKKNLVIIEKLYQGSFDQLANKLHIIGLEAKQQIGERYVFGFKYRMKNTDYLIKPCGSTCTISATESYMKLLQSYLPLEKSNLQDIEDTNAN